MSKKVFTTCLSIMLVATIGIAQAESWDQSGGSSMTQPPQQEQPMQNGQENGQLQTEGQTQTNGQMQTDSQMQTAGQATMTQLEPLVGKTVLDSQQNEIGAIQDIVVDQQSQQAKYVILGAGGFLGIGEDYHAVPWSALNIQAVGDTIQSVSTTLDSQTITNSPTVEMGTERSFDSRVQSQVDSYYQGKGVSIQSNGMGNGAGQQEPMQQQDIYIIPESNGTNGAIEQDVDIIPREGNGTYGDGARSGEPQTGSKTEVDQSDTVAPFGEQSNGQTNGQADEPSSSDNPTSTQYRSGYADGVNRNPSEPERTDSWQTDSTMTPQNGTNGSMQEEPGSVQTNGAAQQFVWFSELSGRDVKDSQDEQVGQLEDLVVDAKQGDISFGLISLDEGTVAVPFSALQMQEDSLVVNAQMDTLKSLAFQSDSKPDFSDPSFQQNTYQQFGQQPPTVYGYVTPQQQQQQQLPALEREYTRLFDSQKTETVSGKITKVEKRSSDKTPQEYIQKQQRQESMSQPQSQSPQSQQKSLHLTVETEQGQTMQVHAGPEQFLKQRNLDLKEGDQVQISGSKAQVMGQDVLIASKISKNGQEVMLRSAQGQPMWSAGQSGSQMRSSQQPQSNGMTNGQQDPSQSPTGDPLIDSQMNGQTNGASDPMKSDKEKKDEWKTNGTNGQSDHMKPDKEKKDQWKTEDANGTNGMTDATSGLQFRSDEQTTVQGTVQSADSGAAGSMSAMDQAVLLKVQNEQGQSQTIYAGPREFIQEKNMSFNDGDKITATGWKKTIAGQEVFIASKIEKDGQTLQLRDMQGKPEWKTKGSSLYNGMDSQRNPSQSEGSNSSESNSTY